MQIKIPQTFFLEEAKKEYSDYQSRLVAELLQNSLDAGARNIRFEFSDSGYSCEDDGKGMNRQTMESGMLTMGGSIKEAGNVGGFGAAKKLIILAMASYSIRSRDVLAVGSVLDYELHDCPFFSGTKIECSYFDGNDFPAQTLVHSLQHLVRSSGIEANIFINNNLFSERQSLTGAKIVNYDWAKFSVVPGSGYVYVRKNGLPSFSKYVNCRFNTYIDVIPESKEIFTQNRDGFRSPYSEKYDKIASEMATEGMSFGRGLPRIFHYKGRNTFVSFIHEVIENHCEVSQELGLPSYSEASLASLSAEQKVTLLNTISHRLDPVNAGKKQMKIKELVCSVLESDFFIDLGDSELTKAADEYVPGSMLKRNRSLAQLWKACILYISRTLGKKLEFNIGFSFDPNTDAAYKTDTNTFLIHPKEELRQLNDKEYFYTVFLAAVEECCHCFEGINYHNEYFNSAKNEMLKKLLPNLSWRSIVEESKELSL